MLDAAFGAAALFTFLMMVQAPSHFSSKRDSDSSAYWATVICTSMFWGVVLTWSHT